MLHAIEALEQAAPQAIGLNSVLDRTRRVLVPKKYDCLGCDVCFPALAANAIAEAHAGANQFGYLRTHLRDLPLDVSEERSIIRQSKFG